MLTVSAPRVLAPAVAVHNKRAPIGRPFVMNGDDGNRTRVQKPLDITFSVGSQSIKILTSERRVTGFRQGSLLVHDRYNGEISVHVHY